MFYIVQNRLNSYIAALPDVMTYVISALSSTTYVEPPANASNLILYPRLFEELKTIMWHGILCTETSLKPANASNLKTLL